MKRTFAILFLVIYMSSTTEFYQLWKLPVLVEHFFEHKTQDSSITLMDFLVIHYGGNHLEGHPQNDDFEQDQRLPFMNFSNTLSFCFVFPPLNAYEIKGKLFPDKQLKINAFDDAFLENKYLSSIWQPPQFG